MDPLNNSLSELRDMFLQRMTQFEEQFLKASTTSNVTGMPTQYADFKVFVTSALNSLQQQVDLLARNMDNIEMRGRRGILLLHGVAEVKDEDTAQVVVNVIKDRMKITSFTAADIKRCHRMGRSTATKKIRPILFKLRDVAVKNKIWFDKTQLKGSGITLSEFLTKARHDLFMLAREQFGVAKSWTRDGTVYVLGLDGSRHRIGSIQELHRIGSITTTPATVESAVATTADKPSTTRPKRAAANKKQ